MHQTSKNQRYPPLFRASQLAHASGQKFLERYFMCALHNFVPKEKKKRSPSGGGYHQQQQNKNSPPDSSES
jgi:hypothetical protein